MTTTAIRPVRVDELRRAYLSVSAGDFRLGQPRPVSTQAWPQQGPVVPVAGACPASGASTLTLALATAAGAGRVIECATAESAGLVAATTAELGRDRHGWMRATRDRVLVERPTGVVHAPQDVPPPAVTSSGLVVVDVAWDLQTVLGSAGWLGDLLRRGNPVVVTAVPTVPGLRRLDAALHRLTRPVVAVLMPPHRRVPRPLTRALDDLRRTHHLEGRFVPVPVDARLWTHGPDTTALPEPVVRAAAQVLQIALESKDTP
ncbi:hypothetical protein [Phycicoccus sonneratiae]|uniref:MinD-like ATPase involved in chromosome partitioning or flagellar assembly n=1 Tax=Phycicoccus sonneratiae TaxID=2807628 RepID=A0ABS2CS08_9MICO|nr:hypothetical protein [Phycicoccus sonneraticus]MBM6402608.1 hypothetical protein [Phycicoccus sonneraticus]